MELIICCCIKDTFLSHLIWVPCLCVCVCVCVCVCQVKL
jgi:hypothetical protein